jgi:hypothetical protein
MAIGIIVSDQRIIDIGYVCSQCGSPVISVLGILATGKRGYGRAQFLAIPKAEDAARLAIEYEIMRIKSCKQDRRRLTESTRELYIPEYKLDYDAKLVGVKTPCPNCGHVEPWSRTDSNDDEYDALREENFPKVFDNAYRAREWAESYIDAEIEKIEKERQENPEAVERAKNEAVEQYLIVSDYLKRFTDSADWQESEKLKSKIKTLSQQGEWLGNKKEIKQELKAAQLRLEDVSKYVEKERQKLALATTKPTLRLAKAMAIGYGCTGKSRPVTFGKTTAYTIETNSIPQSDLTDYIKEKFKIIEETEKENGGPEKDTGPEVNAGGAETAAGTEAWTNDAATEETAERDANGDMAGTAKGLETNGGDIAPGAGLGKAPEVSEIKGEKYLVSEPERAEHMPSIREIGVSGAGKNGRTDNETGSTSNSWLSEYVHKRETGANKNDYYRKLAKKTAGGKLVSAAKIISYIALVVFIILYIGMVDGLEGASRTIYYLIFAAVIIGSVYYHRKWGKTRVKAAHITAIIMSCIILAAVIGIQVTYELKEEAFINDVPEQGTIMFNFDTQTYLYRKDMDPLFAEHDALVGFDGDNTLSNKGQIELEVNKDHEITVWYGERSGYLVDDETGIIRSYEVPFNSEDLAGEYKVTLDFKSKDKEKMFVEITFERPFTFWDVMNH